VLLIHITHRVRRRVREGEALPEILYSLPYLKVLGGRAREDFALPEILYSPLTEL
jgi:hypothetical protein